MTKALNKLSAKAMLWWNSLVNDCSGSDTTEKTGMVVAAVVIVGLAIWAVKQYMPGVFETIFNAAKSKLNGFFSQSPI